MSNFTDAELDYLQSNTMGRLATVGPDGQPHVVPLTYHVNVEEDSIDLGGIDFANSKKWRDVPQFIRLRPRRIVSWGLGEGAGFTPQGRNV